MSYPVPGGFSGQAGGYSGSYSNSPSYTSSIWGGSAAAQAPILPSRQPPLPPGPHPSSRYGGTQQQQRQPLPPGMEPATKLMPQNILRTAPPQASGPPKRPAFKLRRSIQPRPTLSVLNELAASLGAKPLFEYLDVPMVERERRAWQGDMPVEEVGEYECKCTIGDLEFIAEGHTKPDAKHYVSELAVQGLIAKKCELNDTEGVGNSEDNCPWAAIASLALHKLYTDWQSQGYTLPKELENLPVDSGNSSGGGGGGPSILEADKNALQRVNEMAGKMKITLDFELTGEVGPPNDKVFTMSVSVAGLTFSGTAKNKKAAKHAAASAALANRERWYKPPVVREIEEEVDEGEGEEVGGDEVEEEEDSTQPPSKKANVEADADGKGSLPGSHPGNVKKY